MLFGDVRFFWALPGPYAALRAPGQPAMVPAGLLDLIFSNNFPT